MALGLLKVRGGRSSSAVNQAVIETLEQRQLFSACWSVQLDPALHRALTGATYSGSASIISASTSAVTRVDHTTAVVAADTWQNAVAAAFSATTRGYSYSSTPDRYKIDLASKIGVGSKEGSLSNVIIPRNGFTGIDANQ